MLTRQQPKKCDKNAGSTRERERRKSERERARASVGVGVATTGNEKGKTGRTKVKNQFVAN